MRDHCQTIGITIGFIILPKTLRQKDDSIGVPKTLKKTCIVRYLELGKQRGAGLMTGKHQGVVPFPSAPPEK
jgi:hypothetical protein